MNKKTAIIGGNSAASPVAHATRYVNAIYQSHARTIFAAVIIFSITVMTGCSTKEALKVDSGTPATVTAPTTSPAPVSDGKNSGSSTDASAFEKSSANAGGTDESSGDTKTETGLDPVYFDFDSYLLSADARDILTRNAAWLTENQRTHVIIEGHADERGSDEYNLALAEKRAIAARRYIETLGVKRDRMETISYGENKPAVAGHDEATWAKNRRVEFVIVK